MGRKKGSKMSEEQKQLRREMFKGENNPFYGKKHSEETKQKMQENHADFSGDKNPFKKAVLKNPELRKQSSNIKKDFWANIDDDRREEIGKKLSKGYEDIPKNFWTRIKNNAKLRDIEVKISIEYCWDLFLKQDKKCAISGLPIVFYANIKKCTASLDRIDSKLDYLEGNVQWLHKDINRMKWAFPEKVFLDYCKVIVENLGM